VRRDGLGPVAIRQGNHNSMKVPFFTLDRQTHVLRDDLSRAVSEVIDSTKLILGPAVGEAERAVADALDAGHGIGVGSGTDALLVALMAAGIGPGAEVIVPAYSFFATASSPMRLGARVRFVDVDFQTLQMDPEAFRRAITPATRAVIVVHLFGDCADMLRIQTIAADHGILIIEDAAQSFGARHRGRPAGTMGFCGCFSFYPTKNLAAIGDAGMIVTNDDAAAERMRLIRAQGAGTGQARYDHQLLGICSRLDSIQAAALMVRLPHVPDWNRRRQAIAARYIDGLAGLVALPVSAPDNDPVYNQFVIRTPERDALREHLMGHGVGTEIYYPIPLHLQTGLAPMNGEVGDHPRAEEASRTSLALPVFPELTDDEVDYVVGKAREFFRSGG